MTNRVLLGLAMLVSLPALSQVGIGTTTPTSMLDVRGSIALNYRSFTEDIQVGANDNTLVFTGTLNAIATLPDAVTCPGRTYHIKNASMNAALAINPLSAQSIDGTGTGWLLEEFGEAITIVSDGMGWLVCGSNYPKQKSNSWLLSGNSLGELKKFGTLTNYPVPFITNGVERMRLTENGRIGMGIKTPMTEFHIMASPAGSGIVSTYVKGITITGNGASGFGGPGFYLENTDNQVGKRLFKINYTSNGSSEGYVNFQAVSDNGATNVNANIMAITHSGRVGIGTAVFNASNPEKFLVDAGQTMSTNLVGAKASVDGKMRFYIQNSSGGSGASSNLSILANNHAESSFAVTVGINSTGNAAPGITGGSNTAYLVATGNDFVIGNATANKALVFFAGGTTTANEIMRANAAGLIPGSDNSFSLGKNGARWSQVWAADGLIQTSDARMKTSINELPYGLKEVMQMRPVAYKWKDRPASAKIGLIAQEVRTLVPEVVTGEESTETLGMNYAELVPVLINAIKELKQEVDALKKKLEEKEDKLKIKNKE